MSHLTAAELSRKVCAQLPAAHQQFLMPRHGDQQIPARWITDPDWLLEQIRLRGQIWKIEDRRVLATLWWYSASTALVTPALTSLVLTGVALNPSLESTVLHHTASSRLHGSHSEAILGMSIDELATAFRDSLRVSISAVAAISGGRERPLWAIATDAIANRLLWAGQAINKVEQATAIAAPLVAAISAQMPAPRYVDVPIGQGRAPAPAQPDRTAPDHTASHRTTSHRAVRRTSCCLLYRVPTESMCTSCPRHV